MFFNDIIEKHNEYNNTKNESNLSKKEKDNVEALKSFYSLYNKNKYCQFDTFAKKLQVEVARETSKSPKSEQDNCSHYI